MSKYEEFRQKANKKIKENAKLRITIKRLKVKIKELEHIVKQEKQDE